MCTYGWRLDSPAQVGWQKLPVPDNDMVMRVFYADIKPLIFACLS